MLASTCRSTNPARMAAIWPEKNNCANARHAADPYLHADRAELASGRAEDLEEEACRSFT
jgi:hypothetical protein